METHNICVRTKYVFESLNRTMQYGNKKPDLANWISRGFKSYYVVWKPEPDESARSWVAVFKSYYVVWKRFHFATAFFGLFGLNRTMQYGNRVQSELLQPMLLFKSYYVVWKPYFYTQQKKKIHEV